MAGWRVGFVVGNADAIAALAKLKSYLDYGTFQPIQIASIIALNEQDEYPAKVSAIYKKRRDVLVDGLSRAGWKVEKPAATMFVWAEIPGPMPTWARSGSPSICYAKPKWPSAPAWASDPPVKATSASRSLRMSTASPRPSRASARR
jgi:aspartate/methionine/tyrosine aminotransferase